MPTWIGSIHQSLGRRGYRPEAIVVHLMEGSLRGTDQWFNDPRSKVSAHYGIGKNGSVHQYVRETDTAWHCGRVHAPTWKLLKHSGINPNLYTIGIEHEGRADEPWPEAMYQASAALIREIAERWGIPLDRDHVIGHREIYSKKSCPGWQADLDRLVHLARAEVPVSRLVSQVGAVRTRVDLNLRRGAPNTRVDVVRLLPQGTEVAFSGYTTSGQQVRGNASWYRDPDGNYFWAGGTERPSPEEEPEIIAPMPA